MKTTGELTDFFESNDFKVSTYNQDRVEVAELETWTDGGVNMNIVLNPYTEESFKEWVNAFDVDEEIELHRQGKLYKEHFSFRESVEDFEEFHKRLTEIADKLI